jgi:hypothetical protein
MLRTRNVACVVAVAVGLTLIPASGAMADNTASSARTSKQSASERKQNRRISQLIAKTATLTTNLAALNTKVTDQGTKLNGVDTRLAAIEAAAPQIIDGLTKLKDGLTAAGDGLTKLGAAYQAIEYGRAGLFASGAATPTLAAGGTVTSADIPDDGNPVSVNEDAIVVAGATGQLDLNLRAAIRSNESDGDDAAETAGQAGGYLFVVNLDTGVRVACGGAPNPPGIFGTVAGDSIVTPTGTVTNLPLKNIPGGVLRTDTTKPDATSTSLLPANCSFGAAIGTTYSVHYSVNFLDIPTTTTPGPTE